MCFFFLSQFYDFAVYTTSNSANEENEPYT